MTQTEVQQIIQDRMRRIQEIKRSVHHHNVSFNFIKYIAVFDQDA